ncbi:hypothetical protein PRIEUP_LOCUS1520, partial [Pristimantis euphronides]
MALAAPVTWTYLSIFLLETMMGIFPNVFIIRTLHFNHSGRQDLRVIGIVLRALSISTICHMCMVLVNVSTYLFRDLTYAPRYLFYAVRFLATYTIGCTSWLTAWLFFYCIKIVTIDSDVFRWIRTNLNTVLCWMMAVSALIPAVSSSLHVLGLIKGFAVNGSADNCEKQNVTRPMIKQNLFFLCNCMPYFILVITTLMTAIAMKKHSRKMSSTLGACAGASVATYGGVIRTMVTFLAYYSINLVLTVLYSMSVFISPQPAFWAVNVFIFSFPLTQSLFIIYGTPHLKKAWLQMFYT